MFVLNTPMRVFFFAVAISGVSAGFCETKSLAPKQAELLQSLTNEQTPKADKAMICKQLAIYGDDQCVPEVARLLTDPELTSWARITLEAIATVEAQSALVSATEEVDGLSLVGVINSLGVLRAPAAVDVLIEQIASEDSLVAACAAVSLGKIGGTAAEDKLLSSLDDTRGDVRSAVAEGLVLAAESRLANGDAGKAIEIYDAVLSADVPGPRKVEATRGAILSRGRDGIELMLEKLGSDNERIRFVALTAARQIEGEGIVESLQGAVEKVPSMSKPVFLVALGDRGDARFIATMLAAMDAEDTNVRLAAIGVLQKIGDPSCVEALLTAASDNVTAIAEASKRTLAQLDHPGIDQVIQDQLRAAVGPRRVTLIDLVGARRINAVDYLVTAADDNDPSIEAAALAALGQVATLEQLPILIGRATDSKRDNSEAMKALRAACVRMPDQAACAKVLSGAMAGVAPDTQLGLLETVAAMGGPEALAVLGEVATKGSIPMKDASTRLLGNWMSVDAGGVLADVAKQSNNPFKIRAARGYLRLVRQFVMKPPQRHEMVTEAMGFIERTEEKQLLLDAANRYPSTFMLKTVVELGSDPKLADQAQSVGISIARKIPGSRQVASMLTELGVDPVKLEIVKATYGAGDQQTDVTEILRRAVRDSPLVVLEKPQFSDAFGGDPAPGRVKFLSVKYNVNGKPATAMIREDMSVLLGVAE